MTPKQKQLIKEIAEHRYKKSKLKIALNDQEKNINEKIKALFNNHHMIDGFYEMDGMTVEISLTVNYFKINKVKVR